jgi:predicted RNase H-like nuclease (RuvC/YqgF family)
MNEFKRKYNTSIPKELNEIFDKIKGNEYDPMLKVDNSEKINFLEEKLERLDKLLIEKDKKIEQLKKNIKESKNDI